MNLKQTIWLDFDYKSNHYEGEAIPAFANAKNLSPAFDIYFNNEYNGTILKDQDNWISNNFMDREVARIIARKLLSFM